MNTVIESLPSRLPEREINSEIPFEVDELNRDQFAYLLDRIVDIYSNTGCVLAINGEWGTGKTTFINMWLSHLKQQKYRAICYNAWKTDYVSDPFVAIVGELKEAIGDNEEFKENSARVFRILLSAGKTYVKTKTGIDIDAVTDEFKNVIDDYAKEKTTFDEFKKALINYVASVKKDEKTPLIFVIDELDRCNPHYAVKVLERIKHLFDIPNIIFVLSICKSQLEYAIQGFYGSEKIDTANYLRRFIDLEFELPKPPYEHFVNYLFNSHRFQDYFEKQSQDINKVNETIELFKSFVEKLCRCTNLDLRTMDKIFVLCRIVASQVNRGFASEMDGVFLLCYIKIQHYKLYCQIRDQELTLQELITKIEETFPMRLLTQDETLSLDSHSFIYALAPLLYAYNHNDLGDIEKNILPDSNNQNVNLECKIIDKEKLQEALTHARSRLCKWSSIKAITDRIALLYI